MKSEKREEVKQELYQLFIKCTNKTALRLLQKNMNAYTSLSEAIPLNTPSFCPLENFVFP